MFKFRETMTLNSLRSKKPEYNMTLNFYNSEASNYDSLIGVQKKREDRSANLKLVRKRTIDDISRVPPESRNINLYHLDNPAFGAQSHIFHQYEADNINIFFLEKELELLQNRSWYCDGTFTLLKDVNETQVYIIAILIENPEKTRGFSYPVAFAFCQGKA